MIQQITTIRLLPNEVNLELIKLFTGAGDYKNLGGEKQRNMMGNALMERSFDQYKYVKILSKGQQRINGKKYYVENDLYDVLPSDFSKKDYKLVVEDGKVHADYPREFIRSWTSNCRSSSANY